MADTEAITHLAGVIVKLPGGRQIQRCVVCGHKLYDSGDGPVVWVTTGTIHSDNNPRLLTGFAPGTMIRYSDGGFFLMAGPDRPAAIGPVMDIYRLPDDFCHVLIE